MRRGKTSDLNNIVAVTLFGSGDTTPLLTRRSRIRTSYDYNNTCTIRYTRVYYDNIILLCTSPLPRVWYIAAVCTPETISAVSVAPPSSPLRVSGLSESYPTTVYGEALFSPENAEKSYYRTHNIYYYSIVVCGGLRWDTLLIFFRSFYHRPPHTTADGHRARRSRFPVNGKTWLRYPTTPPPR